MSKAADGQECRDDAVTGGFVYQPNTDAERRLIRKIDLRIVRGRVSREFSSANAKCSRFLLSGSFIRSRTLTEPISEMPKSAD